MHRRTRNVACVAFQAGADQPGEHGADPARRHFVFPRASQPSMQSSRSDIAAIAFRQSVAILRPVVRGMRGS
jgi:hypothetical protein